MVGSGYKLQLLMAVEPNNLPRRHGINSEIVSNVYSEASQLLIQLAGTAPLFSGSAAGINIG